MTDIATHSPWYRQPWPWLLMIAPAAAVVAGFFTWWLAATSNNSMVVDDYYREGRAINQQLARDDAASRLGLSATLASAAGVAGVEVELRRSAAGGEWPESLSLRLVHATESALDSQIRLAHQGNGRYAGAGALPASGRWIVHIEDGERQWRLMARADRFDERLEMRADPLPTGDGR